MYARYDSRTSGCTFAAAINCRNTRPDGNHPATLLRAPKHVGEDGERGRHDQCAADTHQGTCGDELVRGSGGRGQHGAEGKGDDADPQGALAAELVAGAARGEQESGEQWSVYPSTIHCNWLLVAPSSSTSDQNEAVSYRQDNGNRL